MCEFERTYDQTPSAIAKRNSISKKYYNTYAGNGGGKVNPPGQRTYVVQSGEV